MARHRSGTTVAITLAFLLPGLGLGSAALAGTAGRAIAGGSSQAGGSAPAGGGCFAGAHTLSRFSDHVYPDTGNGGYTSLHTSVDLVYDATANQFLPGNHVVLTDRATQCLTTFSLDFERKSTANVSIGPDMTVNSVTVNGAPATFTFVQPTYPGDPHGQNDPNPLAHEASEHTPVGGPGHNPLPPACSPELKSTSFAKRNSQNGQQCPANKLVITPSAPIASGSDFTVRVDYTGRPGVHTDGDGTTEGWFRSNQPRGDGGFVTTEPVGTEDWMPLNDHPSAKPTYDFDDTVTAGKTVLANGILMSRTKHAPDAEFPGGSVTWRWHQPAPVASYLVEDSVGSYHLTRRIVGGIPFYQAQAGSLTKARQRANRKIMNMQPDITRFESKFNGPYPFTSDGVVVGRPSASFEEEMQTMITFAGGRIDTDTLYHENMHQWWGDHVTRGELQPDLLQGRHGHSRRVPVRGADRGAGGRRGRYPGRPPRLPAEPGAAVQRGLPDQGRLLDRRAVEPDALHPLRRELHLRAPRRQLHRAAADPGPCELRPCPAADPAAVRRQPHH